MRQLAFLLTFFFLGGCSTGSDGTSWAETTYGKDAAQKLLKGTRQPFISEGGEPYAVRPWVVLGERLDHPDVTQVKDTVFHAINDGLADVATSAGDVKTLVVLREDYKFLPNKDGKTERAEADGYVLRFLDLESTTVTTLKIADNSAETIKSALSALPQKKQ